MKIIRHSFPYVGDEEEKAVLSAIQRCILSTGELVLKFEKKIADIVGVKYACATSSGSSALYLVLKKLPEVFPELRGKDEVIIPSFTCFALSNAILLNGYKPVFADINLENFSLDFEDVRNKLTKKTLCVIFVHAFGICSDLKDFLNLDVPIIEDIAQAFGGRVYGKPVGSFGIASVSSFYATKVITTGGEGGAVLSNVKKLVEEIRDFIDYDKKRYDKRKVRFNFKMGDINAAFGLAQLKRLKEIIRKRKKLADMYFAELSEFEREGFLKLPPKENNIFFRFPVLLYRWNADSLLPYMNNYGIAAQKPIFRPLHFDIGERRKLKNTEKAYKRTVSLPIHPTLTETDVGKVCRVFIQFIKRLRKN